MSQKLDRMQQTLKQFYIPLLIVIFLCCALAIGWVTVRPTTYMFTLNQVANETIRANKTVEDTYQTELNRTTAEESVSDVYRYNEDVVTQQLGYVTNFFAALRSTVSKSHAEILESSIPNLSPEAASATSTTEDRVAYLKKSLNEANKNIKDYAVFMPDWLVAALLETDGQTLMKYESSVTKNVSEAMADAIKASDLQAVQEQAIRKLYYENYNDHDRMVLSELLKQSIVTNYVIDVDATTAAKQAARNTVAVVQILQGQIIVQEGQIIDSSDIRQLELLGMVNSQPNYFKFGGYVFVLLMICGAVLFDKVLSKQLNPTVAEERRKKNVTLLMLVLIVGIGLLTVLSLLQKNGVDYAGVLFPSAALAYLVTYSTKNERYGLSVSYALAVLGWFIFYNESNVTVSVIVVTNLLLMGGVGVVFACLKQQHKDLRSAKYFFAYIFVHICGIIPMIFYSNIAFDSPQGIMLCVSAASNGIISFVLPFLMLPYVDYIFEDNAVLLLNELANPNQPLLKTLITKAPGTYHHSLMVANISANCVEAIGGDSLLARVACYYHDIGKVNHPLFFVENLPQGMENPHKLLSPSESRDIIFDHVTHGVAILKQHGLPKAIVDICEQHHGTTLMKYFYAEELKRNPDCSPEDFRYPGPIPQTKEAAVISIVDSAEAAARAMKEPTSEKIEQLVKTMIRDRIADQQLIDSGLTLNELTVIEENILSSLNGTFHSRVEYPKFTKE